MKLRLTLILLTLSISQAFSQYADCNCNDSVLLKSFEEKLLGVVRNSIVLDTNQYYKNDWYYATIQLTSNEIITNEFLKYSGWLDEFVWLSIPSYTMSEINSQNIKAVTLNFRAGNSAMHFRRLKVFNWIFNDSMDTFVEELATGKISLYSRRYVDYNKNTNEYTPFFDYYIRKPDGLMYQIRLSRGDLIALFPEQKREFRALLRKQRLWITYEWEMVNAVNLYNRHF